MAITEVLRKEDMSPRGRLHLLRQGDGDVVVIIHEGDLDGFITSIAKVEFCTPMWGGGCSRNTHLALIALMEAMEKDNLERPDRDGDFTKEAERGDAQEGE